jgi:hypothetical protein
MRKMLLATRGKVFTLKTLSRLVECSALKKFQTQTPGSLDLPGLSEGASTPSTGV